MYMNAYNSSFKDHEKKTHQILENLNEIVLTNDRTEMLNERFY